MQNVFRGELTGTFSSNENDSLWDSQKKGTAKTYSGVLLRMGFEKKNNSPKSIRSLI